MPWTLSFEIPAPTYSSPVSSALVAPAASARSVVTSILRMAAPPSSITSSITGAGGRCSLLLRGDRRGRGSFPPHPPGHPAPPPHALRQTPRPPTVAGSP